jgi:formate dehydrogenase subunit delta
MSVDHLINMANQIGRFFEAMPDREAALLGAAQHLRNFWAPPMRRELLAYLDKVRAEEAGLEPFIASAIAAHRGVVQPS